MLQAVITMANKYWDASRLRDQLPVQLRETYAIQLKADAFGLKIRARFKHMKTDQEHVVLLDQDWVIPAADLSYLCVVA